MQYRQGDVFIERIKTKVTGKPVPRDNQGRVVLAYGEVTGHAHAILDRGVTLYDSGDILVKGDHAGPIKATMLEADERSFIADTPLGRVKFPKEFAEFVGGQVVTKSNFALLRHEEHTAQALFDGVHRVIQQREYSPEAIRNVAD